MKRMTWLTEERTVAPAAGAPGIGNATSTIRTARHGMPLRSPGAGFG